MDTPRLALASDFETADSEGRNPRHWCAYQCSRCGGVVTAWAPKGETIVREVFPAAESVADELPPKAKSFLSQAVQSLNAPAGAVMLAASAVDAMLKEKGHTDGSLYSRIEKAASDNLITGGMAEWAHQVRLGANEPRHADVDAELPSTLDAERSIEFAKALGQFLFVLPAMVAQGIEDSKPADPGAKAVGLSGVPTTPPVSALRGFGLPMRRR
ncbi:MAG: DUF4145 domain-containing protein [Verrucomicrobia bacterium]|nr:DUF4145 domain-containing protein [Verrucomicrobiota bacterium]